MKTRTAFAISTLDLALAVPGLTTTTVLAQQPGPPPPGYQQGPGGWDAPPAEFRDVQRQGFHDGIEGARKDFDNHRPPNVENREEYRHPHVSRDMRADYRDGFRHGYQVAMDHMRAEHHADRPY